MKKSTTKSPVNLVADALRSIKDIDSVTREAVGARGGVAAEKLLLAMNMSDDLRRTLKAARRVIIKAGQ